MLEQAFLLENAFGGPELVKSAAQNKLVRVFTSKKDSSKVPLSQQVRGAANTAVAPGAAAAPATAPAAAPAAAAHFTPPPGCEFRK